MNRRASSSAASPRAPTTPRPSAPAGVAPCARAASRRPASDDDARQPRRRERAVASAAPETAAARADDRRDARLPRAELLELRPGDQARRRPRRARALPDEHDPGFTELLEMLPGVGQHTCGTGPRRRVRRSAARGMGRPRGRAHRPPAPARGGHRGRPRQDPRHRRARSLSTSSTRTPRRASASPPASSPCGSSTTSSRPADLRLRAELEELILLAERSAFGPSTQAILDEAALRDIPSIRLNDQSLVQLGHGIHQKRIRATMTSLTGSLGVDIASDKKLTNKLLAATGVPVPREVVRTRTRSRRAAHRLPGAVKPLDGNHGRGVMLNLADEGGPPAIPPRAARADRRDGRRDVPHRQRLPLPRHRRAAGGRAARASPRRGRRQHTLASSSSSRTPTRGAASATRRS